MMRSDGRTITESLFSIKLSCFHKIRKLHIYSKKKKAAHNVPQPTIWAKSFQALCAGIVWCGVAACAKTLCVVFRTKAVVKSQKATWADSDISHSKTY